ncbi:MAG: TetR/AcrR family transcriptional regulator [Actinomycetaceae bacterium]
MARPVDPELRAARRLQLVDAGLTAFARHGHGATTAEICRVAGVGSGTFFHHFPTKDALVVAILELGAAETREFFDGLDDDAPPLKVLADYVDLAVADLADPRAAGFVRAVGAMTHRPDVVAALEAEERAAREQLGRWVARAQRAGDARSDLSPERLTAWVLLLVDGFASAVAGGHVHAPDEVPVLHAQVRALLAGPALPD